MDAPSYIKQFPKKRVLVIGDVMLDQYIEGSAERISPEAPIPVLLQKSIRNVLGGAGNVAANAASLGARVTLIGVVGADVQARELRRLCAKSQVLAKFVTAKRPTTTKMRFVSGHHQLVRIDMEDASRIPPPIEAQIVRMIRALPRHDAVIISDYAKGLMGKKIVDALREKFGAELLIADMKPSSAALYRGIRAITPNVKEAAEMTGVLASSDALAARVTKTLGARLKTSIVLTRGEHGVSVREKGKECRHFRNSVQTVRDVTGAGDTLIAAFALLLATGAPFLEAAGIANRAAGVVVGSAGTVALSRKELEHALTAVIG